MKKFYKVEAFRPGEESALKYTFHVYSENEPSAKNMVYRYTKYNGYRVRIANVKEIEILKGINEKKRDFTLALFVWGYSGTTISLTSVSESKLTLIPTAIAANAVTPILMQYTGKLFPITPLAGIC